jgi:hypothetical protein
MAPTAFAAEQVEAVAESPFPPHIPVIRAGSPEFAALARKLQD